MNVSPTTRIRKRRFLGQFSLQTLCLLTVCLGLACAWWRDHQLLSQQIYDLQHPNYGWGTREVLGPPNTPRAGDIPTAWASATQDGQPEWLELSYAKPVKATAIEVHETYNPGALTKVSVFSALGRETTIWTGTDPTPPSQSRGTSVIPVNVSFPIRRVKLYFDSPAVAGWNEIDAVGLKYGKDKVQWAVDAKASSAYGNRHQYSRNYMFDVF